MKNLLLLIYALFFYSLQGQPLTGAYKIVKAQYGKSDSSEFDTMHEHCIKIFKDGYWITAFFGNSLKPFEGTRGGTFTLKNGKYYEKMDFNSWDSTAVGKEFEFDYKHDDHRYIQKGMINTDRFKDFLMVQEFRKMTAAEPLKNTKLEGVWFLKNTRWDDDDSYEKPIEEMKIYCYPRFAWAQYDPVTRQFIGAGGGTYQFDGENLIEHIEYFTYDLALGADYKIEVKIGNDGSVQQTSWGGRMIQIWNKAK
jgi:hypothetical protein